VRLIEYSDNMLYIHMIISHFYSHIILVVDCPERVVMGLILPSHRTNLHHNHPHLRPNQPRQAPQLRQLPQHPLPQHLLHLLHHRPRRHQQHLLLRLLLHPHNHLHRKDLHPLELYHLKLLAQKLVFLPKLMPVE
jgi:hypothetical protein